MATRSLASVDNVLAILAEQYPNLDAGPGTFTYEAVVRPLVYLATINEAAADATLTNMDLRNYATMSTDALDAHMSRYFEDRKTGNITYVTLRLVFTTRKDYFIASSTVYPIDKTKYYTNVIPIYITSDSLIPVNDGFYADIAIQSLGTGSAYNCTANAPVVASDIQGDIKSSVLKAYTTTASTDGGTIEDNIAFYERVKGNLALKNTSTFRGIRTSILSGFSAVDVQPVGLRDTEMLRDIITYYVDADTTMRVHRGGCADIYVKVPPVLLNSSGYMCPLGFPLAYNNVDFRVNPDGLMHTWNTMINSVAPVIDITLRGSMREELDFISPKTNMITLTTNIDAIHNFIDDPQYGSIHVDNLVKQMWPLVVDLDVTVHDSRGNTIIPDLQTQISYYINGLRGTDAPNMSAVAKIILDYGVERLDLSSLSMKAYYLTEDCRIEWFGLNLQKSDTGYLVPARKDDLSFTVEQGPFTNRQMSPRTCQFVCSTGTLHINVKEV